MWLLDHNLPRQVFEVFKSLGIAAETTRNRGWEHLENGALVQAAVDAGFICILTKDVRFRESAAKSLERFPQLSIVLMTLKQEKGSLYAKSLLAAWKRKIIIPVAGQLVIWPE